MALTSRSHSRAPSRSRLASLPRAWSRRHGREARRERNWCCSARPLAVRRSSPIPKGSIRDAAAGQIPDHPIAVGCLAITLSDWNDGLAFAATISQPTWRSAPLTRTQIVATPKVALGAARTGRLFFPALCEWLDGLATAMRRTWPEARQAAPVCPAVTKR